VAVKYSITDSDAGLRITTAAVHDSTAGMLDALISGAAVFGVAKVWTNTPISLALSVVTAITVFVERRVSKRTQLIATQLMFSTSQSAMGYALHAQLHIAPSDIRWLEYRDEVAGDVVSAPRGLFAILPGGAQCLLPGLDAHQTQDILQKIGARFPELAASWRQDSVFGTSRVLI